MANAGDKRKLSIEPITAVCAVILLIACVAVVAVDVNAKFIEKNETVVDYGDTISIDYTGSLYTYYTSNGDKKAVIFDTTLKSVGASDDYLFTDEFNKTSFSSASITLGEGKYLKAFENALLGAKVGQTVYVKIKAADAYPAIEDTQTKSEFTFNKVSSMPLSQFTSFYGKGFDGSNAVLMFEDKNGIPVMATLNEGFVSVVYQVAVDNTFVVNDDVLGKVTLKVTDITDNDVTYVLELSNTITTSGTGIEMISLDIFPDSHMNIIGVDGSNIIFNERTTNVIYGMDLYFVIKVLEKTK